VGAGGVLHGTILLFPLFGEVVDLFHRLELQRMHEVKQIHEEFMRILLPKSHSSKIPTSERNTASQHAQRGKPRPTGHIVRKANLFHRDAAVTRLAH